MKKSLTVASAISLALVPTIALAGAPVELNGDQMDRITAGDLVLPNGHVVFENFDNPAPNKTGYLAELLGVCGGDIAPEPIACHPALTRRSDQVILVNPGQDGPWQAAVHSPVIVCQGGGCPPEIQ